MVLLRRIYSLWCYIWFLGLFLLLFPFFFLFLQREAWHPQAHYLNRLWGHLFFPLCFLPVRTEYRQPLERKGTYVFCSNHTSYLDIAVMGVVLPNFYAFVGKSSIAKVPLFGYMFTKLHIAVDRNSKISRYQTITRASQMVAKGRSVMIFPEGGIRTDNPPALTGFKDGAFRVAIEHQIPVVPITFPYNWFILPDDGKLLFRRHPLKAIVHEPIATNGMTLDNLEKLKEETFRVIDQELQRYASKQPVRPSVQTTVTERA